MRTINLKQFKITTSDSWIIGSFLLMGLCVGFFMPQISVITILACLMVGLGLGLVISSVFNRTQLKQ